MTLASGGAARRRNPAARHGTVHRYCPSCGELRSEWTLWHPNMRPEVKGYDPTYAMKPTAAFVACNHELAAPAFATHARHLVILATTRLFGRQRRACLPAYTFPAVKRLDRQGLIQEVTSRLKQPKGFSTHTGASHCRQSRPLRHPRPRHAYPGR